MNLLLVSPTDFIAADRVRITDRRLQHLNVVNKASAGQALRAGLLGGLQGQATLLSINHEAAEFHVNFQEPPPAKLPITLLLALPRPKMLRRTLQTIASMGVDKLVLINSYRRVDSRTRTSARYGVARGGFSQAF